MGQRQIDQDELNRLYVGIGRAIWQLQYAEDALNHLLALKKDIKTPGSVTVEKAAEILAKHRFNTLGTSLAQARDAGILEKPLLDRLYAFKEQRDWLVHRSLIQNGDDLYVDAERDAVISKIEEFSVEARALQRLIAAEIETFVVRLGVNPEKIDQHADQIIRNLRGDQ